MTSRTTRAHEPLALLIIVKIAAEPPKSNLKRS